MTAYDKPLGWAKPGERVRLQPFRVPSERDKFGRVDHVASLTHVAVQWDDGSRTNAPLGCLYLAPATTPKEDTNV